MRFSPPKSPLLSRNWQALSGSKDVSYLLEHFLGLNLFITRNMLTKNKSKSFVSHTHKCDKRLQVGYRTVSNTLNFVKSLTWALKAPF